MGVYAGPKITSDGLVLSLDAGSLKSYDRYENLLDYSEQFDNAYWSKINSTISFNQIGAPDGTLTADKWIPNNLTTDPRLTKQETRPDATYAFSFYAKSAGFTQFRTHILGRIPNEREIRVLWDLTAVSFTVEIGSAFGSANIQNVGNGWFKCIITYTKSGTATDLEIRPMGATATGDGTSGFYIWGAQLERNPTSSPYYPTAGSSKTRGTILTDLSGRGNNGTLTNGPTFNTSNGGSIVLDGTDDHVSITRPIDSTFSEFTTEIVFRSSISGNSGTGYLIWDHNASGGWPMWLGKTSSNQWYWFWNYGASLGKSAALSSNSYIANTWIHIVVRAYLSNTTTISETNNFAELIVNGNAYSTSHRNDNTSGFAYPISPLYLGRRGSSFGNSEIGGTVSNYSNIEISSFKLYNRVLSRAEIQQNFNALRGRYGV